MLGLISVLSWPEGIEQLSLVYYFLAWLNLTTGILTAAWLWQKVHSRPLEGVR